MRARDMGLTNHPRTNIRKQDVSVAKNYLDPEELEILNLLVAQYFDFAETQAKRRRPMTMAGWVQRLDHIIQLNGDEILGHKGKVSNKAAKAHAEREYEKYEAALKAPDAYDELVAASKNLKT